MPHYVTATNGKGFYTRFVGPLSQRSALQLWKKLSQTEHEATMCSVTNLAQSVPYYHESAFQELPEEDKENYLEFMKHFRPQILSLHKGFSKFPVKELDFKSNGDEA